MGKRIAIICSGPSAVDYLKDPPNYDLVIGVNRMAAVTPCDWWVFNDHEAFAWWPVDEYEPLPAICTSNQAHRLLYQKKEDRGRADRHRWLFYAQLQTDCPTDTGWTSFSMTIAMVLADHLGAAEIVIHGCDWSGVPDYDGTAPPRGEGRNDYRWQNEIHKYGLVCAWLQGRGVTVTRAGYENEEQSMSAKDSKAAEAAADAGAETKAAEKFKPVKVAVAMKQPVSIDGVDYAIGDVVAEIKLTTPGIGLNYLTRAHCDGLVGPVKT